MSHHLKKKITYTIYCWPFPNAEMMMDLLKSSVHVVESLFKVAALMPTLGVLSDPQLLLNEM